MYFCFKIKSVEYFGEVISRVLTHSNAMRICFCFSILKRIYSFCIYLFFILLFHFNFKVQLFW